MLNCRTQLALRSRKATFRSVTRSRIVGRRLQFVCKQVFFWRKHFNCKMFGAVEGSRDKADVRQRDEVQTKLVQLLMWHAADQPREK